MTRFRPEPWPRLRFLQAGWAAGGVPEKDDLDGVTTDPIEEVVADSFESDSSHATGAARALDDADRWRLGDHRKCAIDLFIERLRRFVAVTHPPRFRRIDLPSGAAAQ